MWVYVYGGPLPEGLARSARSLAARRKAALPQVPLPSDRETMMAETFDLKEAKRDACNGSAKAGGNGRTRAGAPGAVTIGVVLDRTAGWRSASSTSSASRAIIS